MPLSTSLNTSDGPSGGKPRNPFSGSASKQDFTEPPHGALAHELAPSCPTPSDSENASDHTSSSDSKLSTVAPDTAPACDGQKVQAEGVAHKEDTSCALASKCLDKTVSAEKDANDSDYNSDNSKRSDSNRRHSCNRDTNKSYNRTQNHNPYGYNKVAKYRKTGNRRHSSSHKGKGKSSDAHNENRSCSRSASAAHRTRVKQHMGNPRVVPCWFGTKCRRLDCWFLHPDGRELDGEAPSTKKRGISRKSTSGKMTRGRSMRLALHRTRQRSSRRKRHESPKSSARSRSRARKQRRRVQQQQSTDDEATQCKFKLASFREFVIKEMDLWTSPDDALAAYEKYKLELAKRSEACIRQSWLLFDLYNIKSRLRWYDLKVSLSRRKADKFVKDLHQKRYEDLSLSVSTLCNTNQEVAATCPTFGHLKPPCFAFDPDTHGIRLTGIPTEVSMWSIIDLLQASPGFMSISVSKPLPGSGLRELLLRFDSAESSTSALTALTEAEVQGCHKLQASLTMQASSLDAFVVPSDMSTAEQISKDEQHSAETLRTLDRIMGIPANLTQAVLNYTGSSEAKLDLQVLYLRSVHNFCFYSSAWCDDEWDLRERCGPALVRGNATNLTALSQESTWTAMHNNRILQFITSAKYKRPQGLVGHLEEIRSRYDAVCAEKTHQLGEGKFECVLCGRKFRGSGFVQKHISRMHVDLFESILRVVREEAAFAEYLADPDRPLVFSS